MVLRRGQAVDLVKPSSGEGSGELLGVVLGEGSGGEYSTHAGLDGGFVGAAGFGITDKGDELSGEGIHRQAGHRLRADGGIDAAGDQRIPEGRVARGRWWWSRRGVGLVAGFEPCCVGRKVRVSWISRDEGAVRKADDGVSGG